MIAPFVDALAENPIGLEAEYWVLQTACRAAAQWQERGLGSLRVGINLFPAQAHDANLLGEVETVVKESGLPGNMLVLEITETIAFRHDAIGHDAATMATLQALRAKGVGLAFDDFGTGYASLSYLTKYPLTRVKFDRTFVRNIAKRCPQKATAVVRSMIVLARNLGLDVIAERVDTQDQAAFLQARRCDEVQRHLYAVPLCERDFEMFVRDRMLKPRRAVH